MNAKNVASVTVGQEYTDRQLPECGKVQVIDWDGKDRFAKVKVLQTGGTYRARVEFLEPV